MHTNQQPYYQKKIFWAGLLLAQFVLFFIFSKSHFIIHLTESFFEVQKAFHQHLFEWIPFSLGDVLYSLLIVYLIYFSIGIIKLNTRNKSTIAILILLNIFYFTYQFFWGLLYFQPPLIEKFTEKEPTLEDAKSLAIKYLAKCKATRNKLQEDENGVFKISNHKMLEQEILRQQDLLPTNLNSKKGTRINSFKPSIFGQAMNYTGIYGYYNPFTAEAQYNPYLPPSQLAFTIAHESAHQMGYAREQEANFIGYLIGINSTNPELKYSTEYFALKSLIKFIAQEDNNFSNYIVNSFSPAMQRDRLYELTFMREHTGYLDAFFSAANNLFLKSNQQDGSISYSYFTDLLLRYEKR